MRLRYHFIVSVVLGLLFYFFTRNLIASIICFFAGVLIDIDHVLDYFLIYKKIDIKKILQGGFHKNKVYVFLHSYEILLILIWFNIFTIAFAIGYFIHMISDTILYDDNNFLGYFLTYRLIKNFNVVNV